MPYLWYCVSQEKLCYSKQVIPIMHGLTIKVYFYHLLHVYIELAATLHDPWPVEQALFSTTLFLLTEQNGELHVDS